MSTAPRADGGRALPPDRVTARQGNRRDWQQVWDKLRVTIGKVADDPDFQEMVTAVESGLPPIGWFTAYVKSRGKRQARCELIARFFAAMLDRRTGFCMQPKRVSLLTGTVCGRRGLEVFSDGEIAGLYKVVVAHWDMPPFWDRLQAMGLTEAEIRGMKDRVVAAHDAFACLGKAGVSYDESALSNQLAADEAIRSSVRIVDADVGPAPALPDGLVPGAGGDRDV